MTIQKPKALKKITVFKTADSLEQAVQLAIQLVPHNQKNKMLKALSIYHNTLINEIEKEK